MKLLYIVLLICVGVNIFAFAEEPKPDIAEIDSSDEQHGREYYKSKIVNNEVITYNDVETYTKEAHMRSLKVDVNCWKYNVRGDPYSIFRGCGGNNKFEIWENTCLLRCPYGLPRISPCACVVIDGIYPDSSQFDEYDYDNIYGFHKRPEDYKNSNDNTN
jgi:hypothetical protein